MINPWTYYIINDMMPNIYPEDPKDGNKMVRALIVSLLVLFGCGILWFFSTKYLIGFDNKHFCEWYLLTVVIFIIGIIFLLKWIINKIMK